MSDYESLKALHRSLPPFSPAIPVGFLPYLAFVLLLATFSLAFYFTTLPKDTPTLAKEIPVAVIASVLGGFGVVALFCSVDVNV